jgi:uncharacterized protein YabN with tetrapyrrole methylase and pyrophosphatase domain
MITFVGGGIQGLSQITIEGLEALQNAAQVLTFQSEPTFFEKYQITDVKSLAPFYRDGAHDEDNYARLISEIESQAEAHGNIAVLLPGHPRLGVTVVQKLNHRSDLRVLPGISSFDTMFNDLEIDPLERGSVILDVNRLLLFDLKIQPELDYYLYHICSVGTSLTHFRDPTRDNALQELSKKLRESFPDDHPVTLIGSSIRDGGLPTRITVAIRDLGTVLKDIRFETSLYVPGLKPKSINRDYLMRLCSAKQVEAS